MKIQNLFLLITSLIFLSGCADQSNFSLRSIQAIETEPNELEPEAPDVPEVPEVPENNKLQEFSVDLPVEKGSNELDLVVIIDHSMSMSEEMLGISSKFGNLSSALNQFDWRISFLTTTASRNRDVEGDNGELIDVDGELYIEKGQEDAEELFKKTVDRRHEIGDGKGSGYERPLANLELALNKKDTFNQGAFRDSATLATLIISDEDESFNSYDQSFVGADDIIEAVQDTWDEQKAFYGFGVIAEPDTDCKNPVGIGGIEHENSKVLAEFIEKTGGASTSICADDYSPGLNKISEKIKTAVTTKVISLPYTPAADTLEVTPSSAFVSLTGNQLTLKRSHVDQVVQVVFKYSEDE